MPSERWTRPALLAATAAACWPVWRWYVDRIAEHPDDAVAVVALLLLLVLSAARGTPAPRARGAELPAIIALAAYAATFPFVPRLASAALAFLALGFTWSLWRHGTPWRPWVVGLGLLAVPAGASVQFYAGQPLRVASGAVALVLLRLGGIPAEREGVFLRWGDHLVMIDAPCSGLRMAWAGMLLAFCLAALLRLTTRATLLAVAAAVLLAVLGNGLRAAGLFWIETSGRALELPAVAHAGVGIVAFLLAAIGLLAVTRALAGPEGSRGFTGLGGTRVTTDRSRIPSAHLAACALAALAPLLARLDGAPVPAAAAAFQWPATFEGRPLAMVALGERDRRFAADFPGHVGRFSDGRREIILRHVTTATRRLHPASQCLRAEGYTIEPRPARAADGGSGVWSCFAARRRDEHLEVCEQIRDAGGRAFPDASSWYWPARLGGSTGPWLSTTVVERPDHSRPST